MLCIHTYIPIFAAKLKNTMVNEDGRLNQVIIYITPRTLQRQSARSIMCIFKLFFFLQNQSNLSALKVIIWLSCKYMYLVIMQTGRYENGRYRIIFTPP